MKFLEKDLERIIFETKNKDLRIRGLYIMGIKFCQLFIGNYGRADLVTIYRDYEEDKIIITVYEFKKDDISWATMQQAARYIKGIMRYVEINDRFAFHEIEYRITLVGSAVEQNSILYAPEIFNNVRLFTYNYDFDGIRFNEINSYKLTDEALDIKDVTF